jgi:hypothetical protein
MPGADTSGRAIPCAPGFFTVAHGENRSRVTGRSFIASSAFGSVHEVFHSTAFHIARNVTLFFVAVFWLGLAYWVYRDARRRIDDPWLVGTAALLGLVPFIGPLVYLLFRPPETLEDAQVRRAEIRALESRLVERRPQCPVCRTDVEPAFLICPVCTTQLKERCSSCAAPLERLWQACPYCTAPVVAKPGPAVAELDTALAAEAAGHAANGPRKPHTVRRPRTSTRKSA